ncbi:MAG: CBS domain-containing protein [Cytophagales bacterium]|nr:CBS domain-containing protein [Cytophagales bacterium]
MENTTPVSRIMTKKIITVSPDDHLETVRAIFENHGFHHIPVVEASKLVGMISYTDYLRVIRELYQNASGNTADRHLLETVQAKP